MLANLKHKAARLRQETYALYLAARHPGVPFAAKAVIGITVAYALSPIDLIPDFIPVIGYLDDLVIVPLGIALALKLVPKEIMAECRDQAALQFLEHKPVSWKAAVFIGIIWLLAAWWLGKMLWKLLK
jgi:uncharacterized membrane protein YkvA (DUF1232 family)